MRKLIPTLAPTLLLLSSLNLNAAWAAPTLELETSLGNITVELDAEKAPKSASNFKFYEIKITLNLLEMGFIKLYELITEKNYKPVAIIAVPVGFVNVVESKELIMKTDIPCIVAKGRKGGSNIAATICNAILYSLK